MVATDAASDLGRLAADDLRPSEFLYFTWRDAKGRPLGENDYLPKPYKAYDLPEAKVTARWDNKDGAPTLVLKADKPALFVTVTTDIPGYFSDNAITLLPGREVRLGFTPRLGAKPTQKALASGLRIGHLRQTY
jgi:beta-mannosidase